MVDVRGVGVLIRGKSGVGKKMCIRDRANAPASCWK